jgi:hypothetical protein
MNSEIANAAAQILWRRHNCKSFTTCTKLHKREAEDKRNQIASRHPNRFWRPPLVFAEFFRKIGKATPAFALIAAQI